MKIALFTSYNDTVASSKFFSRNINGVTEFYCLVADDFDIVSAGGSDATSTDGFYAFFENKLIDYKNFRKYIMVYAATVGFDNLSAQGKSMVCKNFAVGKTQRDSLFTIEQQIKFGVTFHKQSTECRDDRVSKVEAELYNRLAPADAAVIIADVVSNNLKYNYVNFGIEGVVSGDPVGLFDYFNNTTGTPFENSGLKSKSMTPLGMTITELANRCLAILRGEQD
jgi:hypothetical protein